MASTLEYKPDTAAKEYEYEEDGEDSGEEEESVDSSLHPSNTGEGASSALCCLCCIRTLVSKKKKRFRDERVDLDLSYITNRLVAMAFPAHGFEALWRNPADTVRDFLEARHKFHYRIWNLCSEREYGTGSFNCEVERFAWADHTPPPFPMMLPACESMDSWLAADPQNVVVVHCKAGKGRTGLVIAAYLLHSHTCPDAQQALKLFGDRRTRNGRGVNIPSQRRYVAYYAYQVCALKAVARTLTAEASIGGEPGAGAVLENGLPVRASEKSSSDGAGALAPEEAGTEATASKPVPAIARGFIVHSEDDAGISGPAISSSGHAGYSYTLQIYRDAERAPGFSIEQNASKRAAISAVSQSQVGSAPPSTVNSIVPVPVQHILHVGDELLSINGVDLVHRSFSEVVSLLRSATDPLRITFRRPSVESPVSRPSTPPEYIPLQPSDYLHRVARGCGPWAQGSDPRIVPMCRVVLTGFQVSHRPTASVKESVCCRTDPTGGWYFKLFGGPGCQTLMFDSRVLQAEDAYSTGAGKESNGIELVGVAPPKPTSGQVPRAAMSWALDPNQAVSHVACSGDIRFVLCKEGHRKPFVGMWINTAFLPVPEEMHPKIMEVWRETSGPFSTSQSGSPATTEPQQFSGLPANGDMDKLLVKDSPTSASRPLVAETGAMGLTGSAKEDAKAGVGLPVPNEEARASRGAKASTKMSLIVTDVPDSGVRAGCPLLGSLYTAAASNLHIRIPSTTPVRKSSLGHGHITFKKASLDGAVKDKTHKIFPPDFTLLIEYQALNLPPDYEQCFNSGSA